MILYNVSIAKMSILCSWNIGAFRSLARVFTEGGCHFHPDDSHRRPWTNPSLPRSTVLELILLLEHATNPRSYDARVLLRKKINVHVFSW